jgi:hypothetical protein
LQENFFTLADNLFCRVKGIRQILPNQIQLSQQYLFIHQRALSEGDMRAIKKNLLNPVEFLLNIYTS